MAIQNVTVSWTQAELLERAKAVLEAVKPHLLGRTVWGGDDEVCTIWTCTDEAFADTDLVRLADMVRYFADANAEDLQLKAWCDKRDISCADIHPIRLVDLSAQAEELETLAAMSLLV